MKAAELRQIATNGTLGPDTPAGSAPAAVSPVVFRLADGTLLELAHIARVKATGGRPPTLVLTFAPVPGTGPDAHPIRPVFAPVREEGPRDPAAPFDGSYAARGTH